MREEARPELPPAFDLQPHLTGKLVLARPLERSDFDALYAVARDPLLWEQHFDPERWREERFRVFFEEGLASGGALLVLDAASGDVIGSSRYRWVEDAQGDMEIGWTFLARSHWGGRYNGELKRLMLDHAFKFVDHVTFRVAVPNKRSSRALEKIGARLTGSFVTYTGREALHYVVPRPPR
jgi:N-acetyltransferase